MQCIKFVYSHGIMTEGIYRKAGSNINIQKLLSEFRSNAWTVQISREDYRCELSPLLRGSYNLLIAVSMTWPMCSRGSSGSWRSPC